MKKNIESSPQQDQEELRPEYDFRGAVRGKHYRPLHEGYTVKIRKTDGTTEIQEITSEKGIVRLDPDIQQYFHDSETVNQTLRSLMALIAQFPVIKTRTSEINL